MQKAKRIKITGCKSCVFWYKSLVASKFTCIVIGETDNAYRISLVEQIGVPQELYVQKEDCEVIEWEEETWTPVVGEKVEVSEFGRTWLKGKYLCDTSKGKAVVEFDRNTIYDVYAYPRMRRIKKQFVPYESFTDDMMGLELRNKGYKGVYTIIGENSVNGMILLQSKESEIIVQKSLETLFKKFIYADGQIVGKEK